MRSNRKWCKRRGSSLECQNCFFVYSIIDSNLKNLFYSHLLAFTGKKHPSLCSVNSVSSNPSSHTIALKKLHSFDRFIQSNFSINPKIFFRQNINIADHITEKSKSIFIYSSKKNYLFLALKPAYFFIPEFRLAAMLIRIVIIQVASKLFQ